MNQDRHEELARKLAAIEAPPPPEGLLDKLRGDIPDEFPVENRSAVRHFTGWSLGLAASIMVMIGAAYFAVSYQKSADLQLVAPETARPAAAAEKKSSDVVAVSGTLHPTPAEVQSIEEKSKLRAQATRAEEQDKKSVAEKRDDLAPPPAAAKPQVTFAPETPPAAVAESPAMLEVEQGVAGGVAGNVAATADERSVDAVGKQAAAEPQRANAKDAPAAAAPAPMQRRMKSESYAPVRVGGEIPAPQVVRKVDPVLSAAAKRAHVHGVVIVDVGIDAEGNVTSTRVLKGLPYGIDRSVIDAVRRWKFAPTVINGRPVPVIYEVSVEVMPE